MNLMNDIFGEGKELNALQMGSRTIVMFIFALVFIRAAGVKTFGKSSAFDNIIIIMLGAILSRGVTGDSPFVPIVLSGLVLVLMTRFTSWLCIHSATISMLVKGRHTCLYQKGKVNQHNLGESLLSENDLMEAVRREANDNSLNNVEEIFLECNGEMSVVKKKN